MPFVFALDNMYDNLKANNVEYIKPFFKDGDPTEYYIPLNEFVYHISITKDTTCLFYWVDWLVEYDIYLFKKKKQLFIQYRTFIDFNNELKNKNIIWLLWDIILHYSKSTKDIIKQTINSLLELFKIKYKMSNNKTYKCIIYLAINLIVTSGINTNIKLIENTQLFHNLYNNTQIIFEEIKKKEVCIKEPISEKQKLYDSVYKIS